MILIWKNRGLVVILYVIVSLFVATLGIRFLKPYLGGTLKEIGFYGVMGIGFILAAVWTYLTKDDYYRDKEGNRRKMDTVNELFFIKMGIWAYILAGLGLLFIGNEFFHYFND